MNAPSQSLNDVSKSIDLLVTSIPSIQDNLRGNEAAIGSATESLRNFARELQANHRSLEDHEIAEMSNMLYRLHSGLIDLSNKARDFSNKPDEYQRLTEQYNGLFNSALNVLLQDPKLTERKNLPEEDLPLANKLFNGILFSVLSDAGEEIVGQERLPGIFVKMASSSLRENREKINRISSLLYPVILLSASLSPKASIPKKEDEVVQLNNDKSQFVREHTYQFGEKALHGWTEDLFGKCLQSVWQLKRERGEKKQS